MGQKILRERTREPFKTRPLPHAREKMRKSSLLLLALAVAAICTFAASQRTPQPSAAPLSAAELERLANVSSLEEAVLRLAAEKLRQERRPTATVELPVTIKVTAGPPGCHHMCVWQGLKRIACDFRCFDPIRAD